MRGRDDPPRRRLRRSRWQDRHRRHASGDDRTAGDRRPIRAGAWTLRRVETPALDWYRDLFRRVGEEWLWISRARMPDAKLAAIIHSPLVEVYALEHEGRDEGLLELDFREAGQCEIVFFGVTEKADRQRRRPLADEPRTGACLVAADRAALAAHLHPRSPVRGRVLSALAVSAPSAGKSRSRTIRGLMERRRAARRGMCRLSSRPRCHRPRPVRRSSASEGGSGRSSVPETRMMELRAAAYWILRFRGV